MALAKVTLVGYLGKDPEMSYTPSGVAVTKFSLPVSHKDGDKEITTWYNCACWRKLAEVVNEHGHKGMQALIIGDLKPRPYTTKDGKAGLSLDITVETFQMLGKKDAGNTRQGGNTDDTDALGDLDEPF